MMKRWRYAFFLFFLCSCNTLIAFSPFHLDANVFEIDAETNEIVASGNVVVRQGDIRLTSRIARYKDLQQKVILEGDVKLEKSGMVLTCDRVHSYPKSLKIDARGHVVFSYEDLRGKAGRAVYNIKRKKMVLSENPIAYQGSDMVSGRKIIVDIEKQQLSSKGKANVKVSLDRL